MNEEAQQEQKNAVAQQRQTARQTAVDMAAAAQFSRIDAETLALILAANPLNDDAKKQVMSYGCMINHLRRMAGLPPPIYPDE